MDIDKYLRPEFYFSRLDPEEFEESPDVTPVELMSVFRKGRTKAYDDIHSVQSNRWFCIGLVIDRGALNC